MARHRQGDGLLAGARRLGNKGKGALSKPVVQWWLSLNSSTPTQSELTGIELLVVACVVATKKGAVCSSRALDRADAHEDVTVDAERGDRLELGEEVRDVLTGLDVADLDVAFLDT